MKGFKFYLEFPNKKENHKATRKNIGTNHCGTVIAVMTEQRRLTKGQWYYDCVSAFQDFPNNDVCGGSCSGDYLQEKCKHISERQAREIHPKLFVYLDAE